VKSNIYIESEAKAADSKGREIVVSVDCETDGVSLLADGRCLTTNLSKSAALALALLITEVVAEHTRVSNAVVAAGGGA